jgi:hypothetical protein
MNTTTTTETTAMQTRGFEITHEEHPSRSADGGGALVVTAHTPEAKLAVLKHFRTLDLETPEGAKALVSILGSPEPYVVRKGGEPRQDNRAYFLVSGCLELDFTAPYFRALAERTGYTGRGILPDLTPEYLTPRYKWQGLCHTHYVKQVWLEHSHLCYEVVVSGTDWNRKTAEQNATAYAADYMAESVGTRDQEPEFKADRNGTFSPNPNYLKRHAARPAFAADWLWSALVDWWLANEATPAQQDLVAVDGALMAKNHRGTSGLHDLRFPQGLRRSWDSDLITWGTFRFL